MNCKLALTVLCLLASAACAPDIAKNEDNFAARVANKSACRENAYTQGVAYNGPFDVLPALKPTCAYITEQTVMSFEPESGNWVPRQTYAMGVFEPGPYVRFFSRWDAPFDGSRTVPVEGLTYDGTEDKANGAFGGGHMGDSDSSLVVTSADGFTISAVTFTKVTDVVGRTMSGHLRFVKDPDGFGGEPGTEYTVTVTAPLSEAPDFDPR